MKQLFVFALLTLSLKLLAQVDGVIRGKVNLSTKRNSITVDINYELLNVEDTSRRIGFLLSEEAKLNLISGAGVKSYFLDTTTRPVPTAVIFFKEKVSSTNTNVRFQYSIPYDIIKYKQYGFIELGLDWFWFPVRPTIAEWAMRFELVVNIDDDSLKLYSNGKVEDKSKNSFRVTSLYPDYDIDLFFYKGSKVYNGGSDDVKVVANTNNALLMDSIARETSRYLDFYRNAFGTIPSNVTAVLRPQFNDPNAFGYSRKGYFVLQELKTLNAIKLYVAHEVAHFWFIHGERTENAWLTESFAEFSAMLAIKHFYGDPTYKSIINDKQARLERFKKDGKVIPAVIKNGSKNKTMLSQVALYHKGPLLLDQLMQLLGEEKTIYLMKVTFEKRIKTSDDLIDLVGKLFNEELKVKAKKIITET